MPSRPHPAFRCSPAHGGVKERGVAAEMRRAERHAFAFGQREAWPGRAARPVLEKGRWRDHVRTSTRSVERKRLSARKNSALISVATSIICRSVEN
jgi:hypothetical protein